MVRTRRELVYFRGIYYDLAMNEVFFTPQEKTDLLREVLGWCAEAQHWAHFYQGWDVAFKILMMALAASAALGSAAVASHYKRRAPLWLIILNASASTLIAAISGFAFTQLNFATRQRTYETKQFEFGALRDRLTYYSQVRKAEVFERLRIIHSWNDTNPAPPGGFKDDQSPDGAQLRKAQDKLSRIKSAAEPLLNIKKGVIEQLPASNEKDVLLNVVSELRHSLSETDN